MAAADAIFDVINSTPPVTRFYAGIAFVLSLCTWALGVVSPYYIIYHRSYIISVFPPQLWRMVTPFFLTGRGLGILFDTYMIYNYGKDLESQHFNSSGEFLFYLIFMGLVILFLNSTILSGYAFCQVMGLALIYTWSQRNRGRQVRFFVVTLKAQWMPFAILGVVMLQDPASAFTMLSGIVAAHLYEFLTNLWPRFTGGRNLLPTPEWMKFSFEGGPGTRSGRSGGIRAYGTGFDARARDAPAPRGSAGMFTGGAAATGANPAPNVTAGAAWRARGTGHRLGE